jgi:integrase
MNAELTVKRSDIVMMIQQTDLAASTKVKYIKAITGYLATGASLADSHALGAYARSLSASGRAFLKGAVRLWAGSVALQTYAGATPENVAAVQATEYRLRALNQAITVKAEKGTKVHTWLSQADVRRLLATCRDDIAGQRDKLVLGLLTGAGLRREELAGLKWDDVKVQPVKGKTRTVLAVIGKGAKDRVVPISDRLAAALDSWAAVTGRNGYVIRSLGMAREAGASISAVAIFNIVRKAGAAIGRPDLAAHDLRRTYAQLGFESGIAITQISRLLGHSSVSTTQKYLNLDLDLDTTISDFIPFD